MRKSKDQEFANILQEAKEAANVAGDAWFKAHTKPIWSVVDDFTGKEVGQLLDVCGFGFVQINDRRTSFAKYIKKAQDGYDSTLQINHKYSGRQEWSLNEATAYAILGVLNKHGITGVSVYSRID
jgi:hypothetical protein